MYLCFKIPRFIVVLWFETMQCHTSMMFKTEIIIGISIKKNSKYLNISYTKNNTHAHFEIVSSAYFILTENLQQLKVYKLLVYSLRYFRITRK